MTWVKPQINDAHRSKGYCNLSLSAWCTRFSIFFGDCFFLCVCLIQDLHLNRGRLVFFYGDRRPPYSQRIKSNVANTKNKQKSWPRRWWESNRYLSMTLIWINCECACFVCRTNGPVRAENVARAANSNNGEFWDHKGTTERSIFASHTLVSSHHISSVKPNAFNIQHCSCHVSMCVCAYGMHSILFPNTHIGIYWCIGSSIELFHNKYFICSMRDVDGRVHLRLRFHWKLDNYFIGTEHRTNHHRSLSPFFLFLFVE